jgi:ABC-type sugar transport system substrate-binding protein
MKRLRFLVSLTTNDNDYQIEQAKSAQEAARRLNLDAQVIYSGNDSVTQSTQLLNAVQAAPQLRPDAIIFEPVGATALPQVARAAAAANVGWVVLNREASYISDLRRQFKVPVFCVSNDGSSRRCCREAAASSIYRALRRIPRRKNAPEECCPPSPQIFRS